jgi:uncharacterized phage-associated protein
LHARSHWQFPGMAHVFDVARYVLERQGPVTTLKLQKLMYYVQAWAVVNGEPLFSDGIKAWAQGPVVPALFHAHKGRRSVTLDSRPPDMRGLVLDEDMPG